MHACMSLKGKEPRLPTFEAQQSEPRPSGSETGMASP